MTFPKFTIRQLFWLMAAVAVYSAVVAWAVRGSGIAYALAISIAAISVPVVTYCMVYWTSLGFARVVYRRGQVGETLNDRFPSSPKKTLVRHDQ